MKKTLADYTREEFSEESNAASSGRNYEEPVWMKWAILAIIIYLILGMLGVFKVNSGYDQAPATCNGEIATDEGCF